MLQQVQDLQLRVEVGDARHGRPPRAEHEARLHLVLVDAGEPQPQVLAAAGGRDLDVVAVDGGDGDGGAVGHQEEAVALLDEPVLGLFENFGKKERETEKKS